MYFIQAVIPLKCCFLRSPKSNDKQQRFYQPRYAEKGKKVLPSRHAIPVWCSTFLRTHQMPVKLPVCIKSILDPEVVGKFLNFQAEGIKITSQHLLH